MFEYIDKKSDAKKVYLNYFNDVLRKSGFEDYTITLYSEQIDFLYIIFLDNILKNEFVIKYIIYNRNFTLWAYQKLERNKYKILRDHIADELLKITFEYMTKFNRSKSRLKENYYNNPKFNVFIEGKTIFN